MNTADIRAENLFPSARALFQEPEGQPTGRGGPGLRWLAVLAAVGTIVMVGRWIIDWADRNI